ncbi:MAG: carbohydrate kinase [Bacillus sp. (in: firmicutes)]
MNEKEALILQLIKENPFITQNELADKTTLSRSAVAGYISSLTKQGKLLGRAYMLPNKKSVLCVGGSNVDRKLQAIEKLSLGTSNPASSSQSCGGVARNIGENLGRLGCDTSLLTVVGEDTEGEWLLEHIKSFVDTSPSKMIPNVTTGTYTAVLDTNGEMSVALADMYIYDCITTDFIEKRWGYFASAEVIVLDTNFPAPVLKQIINRCHADNIALCITPVSSPKIKKLPHELQGVTWMIANKDEAEALANMTIHEDADYMKAAQLILNKGVENVVITRGSKGLLYATATGEKGEIHPPAIDLVDVTGAGDSLVAGLIYAHLKGCSMKEACQYGIANSALTIQSSETVNVNLNEKQLQEAYTHYFH